MYCENGAMNRVELLSGGRNIEMSVIWGARGRKKIRNEFE
jgi:hypothetical protein